MPQGWRACPSLTQITKGCATRLAWTKTPIVSTTLFTVYRQFATTTYSQKDLSIQNVESVSEPIRVATLETDLELIWNRIFLAGVNSTQLDLESINVTITRMAWKYRTYTEFFPDKQLHVELLQNFLSVPLQFAITAMQFANYTLALPEDKRTFPPELLTTATGGRSIKRFVSQPWTVLVFIAAGTTVVMLSGVGFWWILTQPHPLPKPSGIVELDFVNRVSDLQKHYGDQEGPEKFADLVHDMNSRKQYSAWQIIKALQERRLGLTPMEMGDRSDGQRKVVPVLHLLPETIEGLSATNSSTTYNGSEKTCRTQDRDIV